jgi:DNA-binding PadR family transcriptional regulator
MSELPPTSHAILALLSIRSWSAYDLTGYMRGSTLRAVWPRAESRIYAEVKRLEERGLASAAVQQQGGRRRSVYSITEQGEAELREWMSEPSKRFLYESEAMLKIAYADKGSFEDLDHTLAELRAEVREDLAIMAAVFRHVVDGGASMIEGRVALNALVSEFILEVMEARLRWVERAEAHVAEWNDVRIDASKTEQGRVAYARMLDRINELLKE